MKTRMRMVVNLRARVKTKMDFTIAMTINTFLEEDNDEADDEDKEMDEDESDEDSECDGPFTLGYE